MTEAEWLDCMDVNRLLVHLTREHSPPDLRKLRLFVCACCRRLWDQLSRRLQQIVESAELFADGRLSRRQLIAARHDAKRTTQRLERRKPAVTALLWAVYDGDRPPLVWVQAAAQACVEAVSESAADVRAWAAERTAQAALLHDLFGNPFRAVAIDPACLTWHDGLVAHMAQDIYEEHNFEELPVLGDALEEAGCHDDDILSHCRAKSEHARGCWLLDGLLGKA
jgi:hypothetical protein